MEACGGVRFSILLLCAASAPAHAQAVVETALGVGRAATAAGPMNKVSKRTAAVLDKTGKALETRKAPASAPRRASAVVRPRGPDAAVRQAEPYRLPEPAASYEDPSGVKTGMDYEEVLRRFGPPTFMLTTAQDRKTLSYTGKEASVDAEVRDGKVVAVRSIPASRPDRP